MSPDHRENDLMVGGFHFVTNGVRTGSRGAEVELAMPLTERTKLELGYSYSGAKMTIGFSAGVVPELVGYSGDRLRGVSKEQGTVALDFAQPLANGRDFHARVDAPYRGDFWTAPSHSPTAVNLPGFTHTGPRA